MFEQDLTKITDRELLERIARDSRSAARTATWTFYAVLAGICFTGLMFKTLSAGLKIAVLGLVQLMQSDCVGFEPRIFEDSAVMKR